MSVSDQIDSIRSTVQGLQVQVGRIEERLAAHSDLSVERQKNLETRVGTAETAILRQLSEIDARMSAESVERTKRFQISAGVVTALISAVAGGWALLHNAPPAPAPASPPVVVAPTEPIPG